MKLFLREQIPLFVMFLIQMLLIPTLYYVNGDHDLDIYVYSLILSSLLLLVYLGFRYFTLRNLYQHLSQPLATLDQSIQKTGYAPLAEAVDDVLHSQYYLYQTEIHQIKKKLEDHVIFLHQWVHQMKTPVSVIQMTMEEEGDAVFDQIQEEVDRLQKGLELVMYTSRLEQFQHDFQVEKVMLKRLAQEVVSEHKRFFIRKKLFPIVEMEEETAVYTDEKWLAFLLGQLVINAIRYTTEAGRKVWITGHLRENQVVLEVRDQGVGIPTQDRKRVWEPYYTGQNGRRFSESTGMGLYLVSKVCRQLGHRVELESTVGEGTMVRILFSGK
ncbi:sensor histidine kinase [Risungbinella massiliensis]|uniref:sensor histidine kinase n=1 Tax=Risungbinella massiliensis TaxID=1329796 RepID=UPI0005CC7937|nr:sensor histidine kinase [Risungbinella massiliensis]